VRGGAQAAASNGDRVPSGEPRRIDEALGRIRLPALAAAPRQAQYLAAHQRPQRTDREHGQADRGPIGLKRARPAPTFEQPAHLLYRRTRLAASVFLITPRKSRTSGASATTFS
jgi:hypothetical protein